MFKSNRFTILHQVFIVSVISILTSLIIVMNLFSTKLEEAIKQPDNDIYTKYMLITPLPDGKICEPISSNDKQSWEQIKQIAVPVPSGVGNVLPYDDVDGAIAIGRATFATSENTALTARLRMLYPNTPANSQPKNLRFMIFLNEQQLIGAIGGFNKVYQDIVIQPGAEATLTINIPPLKEGIYDMVVVGIADVDKDVKPTEYTEIVTNRYTFVVGENTRVLPRDYIQLDSSNSIASEIPISLNLSLNPIELRIWNGFENTLLVAPNTVVQFYVQAGYDPVINSIASGKASLLPTTLSAFISIFNYQQVPINSNTSVYYVILDDEKQILSLPSTIRSPSALGRYDIVVLRINYPGVPACILHPSSPDGSMFSWPIYARRVSITTVQK